MPVHAVNQLVGGNACVDGSIELLPENSILLIKKMNMCVIK